MEHKPNIILIVMDAVRADHLSCYGYYRKTTPNIDKIAKQGILFENAFSTAEWSPPPHASIFTGKYPSYHGVMGRNLYLGKENTTLAEVLSKNGYQTFGISGNNLIGPINGFAKGFQEYVSMDMPLKSLEFIKESPRDTLRTIIYGLDYYTYRINEKIRKIFNNKRLGQKPFFLFIQYFNCHAPYDPPRPFKKKFCKNLIQPKFYMTQILLEKVSGKAAEKISNHNFDIQKLRYIASNEGHSAFMAGELEVHEREWEIVKSWYDGEIAYLDHRIGELINLISEEDIFDDTLLIITADHGENFGEHGLASHHFCLYDSLIHVPLIITYPNVIPRGRKFSNLVSTIDLYPTVLNTLNIRNCGSNIQGRSLYPFKDQKVHDFICAEVGVSDPATGPTHSVFRSKLKKFGVGLKCLRTEFFKYILYSDQRQELYDLRNDPHEQTNILHKDPKRAEDLRSQLEKAIDISYFGPEAFPHRKGRREMLSRLKALGYFG